MRFEVFSSDAAAICVEGTDVIHLNMVCEGATPTPVDLPTVDIVYQFLDAAINDSTQIPHGAALDFMVECTDRLLHKVNEAHAARANAIHDLTELRERLQTPDGDPMISTQRYDRPN